MIKADLHIHTEYSFDCATSLQTIIHRCQKKGVDCVAVADHGTIVGALKLKEIAPFTVVVAEEVLTPIGEIMGMFLTEEVPSGISVDEAIARIKEQGGADYVLHKTALPSVQRSLANPTACNDANVAGALLWSGAQVRRRRAST